MAPTTSSGVFQRYQLAFPKVTVVKDTDALRIGILGAATIAPMALVNPAKNMSSINVVSVAARDENRAKDFAKKHGIPHTHPSYDALLSDPTIDCIYNPLPNGLHFEWTKKALEAGKHVLLEKPSCSNAEQTKELFEIARSKNLILLEAFHYRFHPASIFFRDLIKQHLEEEGHKLERIETIMAFFKVFPMDDIRFNLKLAGGVFMDAGGYVVNAARFFSGLEVKTVDHAKATLVAEQVDGRMEADVTFGENVPAKITATLTNPWLSLQSWKEVMPIVTIETDAKIFKYGGYLFPGVYHYFSVKDKATGKTENLPKQYGEGFMTYRYQLEAFVKAVKAGKGDQSISTAWVSGEDSVNNMTVIDTIYKTAGLQVRE
ncbi:hypothetical protein BG004_008270 [Podila humilis]|nr:hypothetical protein BG004_008270 [Podila humilis]